MLASLYMTIVNVFCKKYGSDPGSLSLAKILFLNGYKSSFLFTTLSINT